MMGMGKFHGLMGKHPEVALESPGHHNNSKHQHGPGSLQQHAPQSRSTLVSPCGKPPRYSDESEDGPEKMLIPSAVVSRLQTPATPTPRSTTPAHPNLQPEASQQQQPQHSQYSINQQQQYTGNQQQQQYAASQQQQFSINQQQYSRLAGKMLSMVNELRATGADVALELPTIVVCGQQSAGKSSVVEAICGIPLPRNQETCTRCPTEVRLSQQPPSSGVMWEAVVKLRRDNGDGNIAANAQAALAWQLQQLQQPEQQHASSVFSLSSGYNSAVSTPAASRQPSATVGHNSNNSGGSGGAAESANPEAATLSLESVYRAGITSPADLPAAVQAAQTSLLSQPRLSSGDASRRIASHTSINRGGSNAAAEAAIRTEPVSGSSSGPLKFTRDVVVVEVRGAPVDLTLIDLPGIIHSVEKAEDEHYKHLVADLATTYMKRPGTVIVATITCKEDIDTQVVLSMARDADPAGERTLGVLTKPDQVEEGCHGQWLQVLAGERYPLALGWYVVRNPNQAALVRGTTGAQARQQEEAFFGSIAPWNRLSATSKARLGTLKLREAMSKQLVKMVTASRPALMAAAQAQLTSLRAELAGMPPAAVLGDGHAEMLRLIDDVSMSIQEEVLARSQSKQFYQHLLTNFQQLKSQLASSRPCFLLPKGNGGNSSYLLVTCALDDDLGGDSDVRQQQQQQQQQMTGGLSSGAVTPTGNAKSAPGSFNIFNYTGTTSTGNTKDSNTKDSNCTASSNASSNSGNKEGLGVFIGSSVPPGSQAAGMVLAACPHQVLLPLDSPEAGRGMSLEDVRQLVDKHHSIELPGFSPYSAVEDLVSKHQRGWAASVTDCAAASHRQLLQLVMLHVGRTFDRFPRAADHIRELATELLEELHHDTTTAVDSLVSMELSGAFATARREFSRASNQHLEGLRTLMAATGPGGVFTAGSSGGGAAADGDGSRRLSGVGGGSIKQRAAGSEHGNGAATPTGPPHTAGLYEPSTPLAPIPATTTGPGELLQMMAVVLTYFSISCRRLADTVSMSIMHHLISSFNSKFRTRLASQLLTLSPEAVGSLLVEDAACVARRNALKAKKDLLEQAMKVMRAAG